MSSEFDPGDYLFVDHQWERGRIVLVEDQEPTGGHRIDLKPGPLCGTKKHSRDDFRRFGCFHSVVFVRRTKGNGHPLAIGIEQTQSLRGRTRTDSGTGRTDIHVTNLRDKALRVRAQGIVNLTKIVNLFQIR